jgi:hypothetical protein
MIEDRLLGRLGWTIPAITITLSTIIHALSGDARAIPFFISEGDYPGLQRIVFTTGLFCTGIILCLVSYRLWKVNLQHSRKFWLHLSLACGIWVGVNISAMAYFNMYDYLDQHIFTSMNVFHFGKSNSPFLECVGSKKGTRSKSLEQIMITLSLI